VQAATKIELIINLKTADEVIEQSKYLLRCTSPFLARSRSGDPSSWHIRS
jgi:hypothetical protein